MLPPRVHYAILWQNSAAFFHPAGAFAAAIITGSTCWEAGVVYIYKNIPGPPKPYWSSLLLLR